MTGVRLEQATAADGRPVARVHLALARPSEYRVRSARSTIRVELTPKTVGVQLTPKPVAVELTPKPADPGARDRAGRRGADEASLRARADERRRDGARTDSLAPDAGKHDGDVERKRPAGAGAR